MVATLPHPPPAPHLNGFRQQAPGHRPRRRYGNLSYKIPVPPGRYAARRYFWDYWWGALAPDRVSLLA